jgi:hypothetical protein
MVTPSRKRGPFDPRWPSPRCRGHLRLVSRPDGVSLEVADGLSDQPARPTVELTRLPTFIPSQEEHNEPEEDRDAAAPDDDDQGTGPRAHGDDEDQEAEENLTWQIAVALPIPTL